MYSTRPAPGGGLGFPILPIVMGASALVGLFKKKKPKITEAQAKSVVQQSYLEILERDPWNPYDKAAEGFITCQLEGWCDADQIRTWLLQSDEYHKLQKKKAAEVYGSSAASGGGALPSFSAMGLPSEIGGIPLPYLAGGILLLLLLRRR